MFTLWRWWYDTLINTPFKVWPFYDPHAMDENWVHDPEQHQPPKDRRT